MANNDVLFLNTNSICLSYTVGVNNVFNQKNVDKPNQLTSYQAVATASTINPNCTHNVLLQLIVLDL
jgi:hypothetical protein